MFDLLASLEEGFTHLSAIQMSVSEGTGTPAGGEAKLGGSNLFALFGVTLGARSAHQSSNKEMEATVGEIVHTPALLFARLRGDFKRRGLVREVSGRAALKMVQPDDFVEF